MNRQELLESIAATICDYRFGEIPPITPDHVERWVSQFDNDDQLIILNEINFILGKYYVSKERAKSLLIKNFIKTFENPTQTIPNVKFLNIQRKGSSQKNLLELVNEIIISRYSISIDEFGSHPLQYIYLDDCLFSGNTVFRDIDDWFEKYDISKKELYLIFLAGYSSGIRYVQNRLLPIAKRKEISVQILHYFKFENLHWNQEKYECLWSTEVDDEYVNRFVKIVQESSQSKSVTPRLFRPNNPLRETLFSCPEARNIVESAFLRKGAYIASLPKNRQSSMRPMGYEYLESLGFGSMFVTYRNIANNCPLVLWWGDPSYPSSNPFSKWYPLFPRKVNQSSSYD